MSDESNEDGESDYSLEDSYDKEVAEQHELENEI